MTTARIARVGKFGRSRFIIGIGILIIIVGLFAIFHSSRQQLDEARKIGAICGHQQERINLQLEAAENKLKTERKRHEQQEHELQRQAQGQTEIKERSLQEANLKFTSLQQHYKLLKSQLEDFKEESSKSKTTQAQKITSLENQIKELQKTKDSGTNVWKTKYTELLNEKLVLEQKLAESHQKKETPYAGENGEPANLDYKRPSTVPSSHKNFNSQVAVNDNLYEISIKYSNDSKTAVNGENVKNNDEQHADANKKSKKSPNPNSTENVNVGLRANNLAVTPSTSTHSQKAVSSKSKVVDAKNENVLWPIEQLAEPSTIAAQIKAVAQNNRKPVKLPHGVVPFQNNLDAIQLYDEHNNKVNSVENNRYSNIINEAVEEPNVNEPKHDVETSNELQNINGDSDTGAHEENDSNGFVVDEHNNHMQKPLRHQNNDALNKVDGFNVKLNNENNVENSLHIANDEDLQIPLKGDKLKNEVNEDQGKAYPDEVNFQVEDEDDDEYTDHLARKQEKSARGHV